MGQSHLAPGRASHAMLSNKQENLSMNNVPKKLQT